MSDIETHDDDVEDVSERVAMMRRARQKGGTGGAMMMGA